MHASAAQQGCMQRPAAYSRRLRLQPRADAAARLRGEPRRVQRWIADVRHWSSFYPGAQGPQDRGCRLDWAAAGCQRAGRCTTALNEPGQHQLLTPPPPRRPAAAGTKSAVKLGNGQEPIRVGSKFELQREMLGLKLPMA